MAVGFLKSCMQPALLAVALACPSVAMADDSPLPAEIRTLLTLPEDKIDVGNAALIFAKSIKPDLDVQEYSNTIDRLVQEARDLMGSKTGPDDARVAINAVLYFKEGYRYDFSPGGLHNPNTYFLPGILDTRQGQCFTLPMLYMAVAQRLGLAAYPVLAPSHTFLRITDMRATAANIEATSGGGAKSDASYISELHITDTALKRGTYMRTMSYHEYLGFLLAINASYYAETGHPGKAALYYAEAWKVYPHIDYVAMPLTELYYDMAHHEQGEQAARDMAASRHWNETVSEMGARWEDYPGYGHDKDIQ